jgi:hypothetical protein
MHPVTRGEILPIAEYEIIRPRFRQRIIEEKKIRRVALGEHLSAVFENRDTVLYQIQEMLRTERITSEPAIEHEISTYNDLIPGAGQLSLTLFVEIPDRELRERTLVELAGLEDTVALEVDSERFAATGDFAGVLPGRTTAVHYFKFTLSAKAQEAIRRGQAAALVVSHPRHPARAELPPATLASLAADLADVG